MQNESVKIHAERKCEQIRSSKYNSVSDMICVPSFPDTYHISSFRYIENLSNKLTEYTIPGLEPGERYRIELGTKTGTEATLSPITEIIMTKPLPVKGVKVVDITPYSAVVKWQELDGHSCLKGFQIIVTLGDERVITTSTLKVLKQNAKC